MSFLIGVTSAVERKLPLVSLVQSVRCFNSNRCAVTKIRRSKYLRLYPTVMAFPDGSTLDFRYQEPRKLVKIPLLLEDLSSQAERLAWLGRRKKHEKIEIKEDTLDVAFDATKYFKFLKKAKN